MSSRISSKEQQCASRVLGDICWILCSTINRSVCTLYWNKNISTFWINGAVYHKIKSCALVGTSYIILEMDSDRITKTFYNINSSNKTSCKAVSAAETAVGMSPIPQQWKSGNH
jgi:hypothetical protein